MNRLILVFVCAIIGLQSMAQVSFSFSDRVVTGAGPFSSNTIEGSTSFQNNTTDVNDTIFKWKIINIDKPTEWDYGMCDPNNCMFMLKVGDSSIFEVGKGKSGAFKIDFTPNNKSGKAMVSILVSSVKYPSQMDTLYGKMQAWASGIKENQNIEMQLYPVPAKDKLILRYPSKETTEIVLYNVIGNQVKTFHHKGNQSEFDISDLQNGFYILRFKDGNKILSKSFNKVD